MQTERRRRSPETLFILALFCVFALSAMAMALMGAGVYRKTADQMDATFDRGAAVAYLRTKFRQGDVSGALEIGELEGVPAVIMRSYYDEKPYYTYLYFYDGALRELFTLPGSGAGPSMGEEIVELKGLEIERVSGELIKLTTTDRQDIESEIFVHLRGGGA